MRQYKLNPDYPGDAVAVSGVNFNRDTVVSGDQWEQFTRQQFPGIPPVLVQTAEAPTITAVPSGTPAARQAKREEPPKPHVGPSGAISMAAMGIDREREAMEEEEKAAARPVAVPESPVTILRPEYEKREEAEEKAETHSELTLMDLRGVGSKSADLLDAAGYKEVADVAKADPTDLLRAVKKAGGKLNLATARSIVKSARELLA